MIFCMQSQSLFHYKKLLSHIDVYAADQEAAQEGKPMPSLDGTLHSPPFESMALILALSCLHFVLRP